MAGQVSIDWGDGTPVEDGPEKGDVTHTYAQDGTYTIKVCSKDDSAKCTTKQVTIPMDGGQQPGDEMVVNAIQNTDDATGMTVDVTVDNKGQGQVTLTWGEGDPATDTNPGDGQAVSTHAYPTPGEKTIQVADDDDTSRTGTATVTLPFGGGTPGPAITAEADPADATGRTAAITLEGFPADSPVTVDWGDDTQATEVPAGETTATHQYAETATGEQTITATSATDPSKKATATFTPGSGSEQPGEPTVTAEKDTADTTGRTAKVTLAGFPQDGAVTVDWGDDTQATEVPAGETTATHQYAETATGEQTITATSATDPSKKATATFTPGSGSEQPGDMTLEVAEDATDTTHMTAKATVTNTGQGTTTLDFGDGTEVVEGPEEGDVTHQYTQAGTYTVTATDADDAQRTATAEVVVPFGEGGGGELKLTVAQAADVSDAYTVDATVDNAGKPASVDFGDDSPAADNPGDGTTATQHTYTKDGTYTVTATDKEDTARKGTQKLTVPGLRVVAQRNADDNTGQTVDLFVGNGPALDGGEVTVTWGEGEPATDTNPGDGETASTHAYPTPGEKTIHVVDADDPSLTGQVTITLPLAEGGDLELVVVEDRRDATRMTAIAFADNKGSGPVRIEMGDGSGLEAPGTGAYGAERKYDQAGDYAVTAEDPDDPARTAETTVTVPFTDGEQQPQPQSKKTSSRRTRRSR